MTRLLNYNKKIEPEGFVDDPSHSAPIIHNLQSPYCNPVKWLPAFLWHSCTLKLKCKAVCPFVADK